MTKVYLDRQISKTPILVDIFLLITVVSLVIFSLLMIYSATGVVATEKYNSPYFFVKRQAIAVIIGFVGMYFLSNLKVFSLKKFSHYFIFFIFILLGLTFIPGLSHSSGGATRWINLPFLKFQPAELVKIFYVIFLAGYYHRQQEKIGTFIYGIFIPLAYTSLVAAVLLAQPDFGSSAVLCFVTIAMAIAVGVKIRHLLICSVPIILAVIGLIITSPYRLKRILVFLSPGEDVLGRGYQLSQSLIAVSSGELTGVGIGKSMQKLYFLPAAHTDFIFAVIAEEFGFIGSVILILAFCVILWRGLAVAKVVTQDIFAYCLAIGATMLLVIPAFFNVGVVTGMLPTKGLVLPLIGYGGSSMICSLWTVGLLLALVKYRYRNAI